MATPFGVVMAGKESANLHPSLNEQEVKLAYSMGEWIAQVSTVNRTQCIVKTHTYSLQCIQLALYCSFG